MKTYMTLIAASTIGIGLSQAAVTSALTTADVNASAGNATHNFDQTFNDSNGVAVTLNFEFLAAATSGTPTFGVLTNRLGMTSVDDAGYLPGTSFNEGEVFTLTVSYVSATVPVGETLQTVNFDFSNINAYRAGDGSTGGSVTYDWNSSARSATLSQTASTIAAIAGVSDDLTFDLLTGDYIGTLSISNQVGPNESGMRFGTDGFDATLATTTSVPEPSSAALLGLGGLALILRRRK